MTKILLCKLLRYGKGKVRGGGGGEVNPGNIQERNSSKKFLVPKRNFISYREEEEEGRGNVEFEVGKWIRRKEQARKKRKKLVATAAAQNLLYSLEMQRKCEQKYGQQKGRDESDS